MAKKYHVSLRAFDPEVDALNIETPDKRKFTFVADMAVIKAISEDEKFAKIGEEDSTDQIEALFEMLELGCKARHPDIDRTEIESWFPTIGAFRELSEVLGEYLSDVVGGEESGDSGEVQRTPGLNSGRTRDTISASQQRN